MKKENETIIIESRKEAVQLMNVLEIASHSNFLTPGERQISYELSKMLDMMYASEK